jgi:hypothetical protein
MPPDPTHQNGLLLLHPADNVFTASRTFEAGESLRINGQNIPVTRRIPLGYKIAASTIPKGQKILKYGVPIGSAIRDIAVGEIVHTDNLQSDYLPTFTLEENRTFIQSHS